jgi:hypothetical protein
LEEEEGRRAYSKRDHGFGTNQSGLSLAGGLRWREACAVAVPSFERLLFSLWTLGRRQRTPVSKPPL